MLNKNDIKVNRCNDDYLSLEDKLNAVQADRLYKDGMIKEPALTGLADDYGILDSYLESRFDNRQIKAVQNANPEIFLSIIATQAFGSGLITQFRIKEKEISLSEFTDAEISGLKKYLADQDPYFMACTLLDAHPGSEDKNYLDSLVMSAVSAARGIIGERIFEKDYLYVLARVLFDTGITLASI